MDASRRVETSMSALRRGTRTADWGAKTADWADWGARTAEWGTWTAEWGRWAAAKRTRTAVWGTRTAEWGTRTAEPSIHEKSAPSATDAAARTLVGADPGTVEQPTRRPIQVSDQWSTSSSRPAGTWAAASWMAGAALSQPRPAGLGRTGTSSSRLRQQPHVPQVRRVWPPHPGLLKRERRQREVLQQLPADRSLAVGMPMGLVSGIGEE